MKVGKIAYSRLLMCLLCLLLSTTSHAQTTAETEEPTEEYWTWYPSFTFFPTTLVPSGTQAPEDYLQVRPSGADMTFPGRRYHYWNDLTPRERQAAEDLKYTQADWEQPGTGVAEEFFWSEFPEHVQEDAAILGFDEFTWDCFQHHVSSILLICRLVYASFIEDQPHTLESL
jgi:hypothetical protein